ncbi:MAG: M23 family peptidase [Calditrichaeota bacterium]|nr:MAG: M23 family peptidase [Calditrichota bacterium]
MRDKRIKLIYFSLQGSESKEVILSWKVIIGPFSLLFGIILLLVGISISVFTDNFHNFRIDTLTETNAGLRTQLNELGKVANELQTRVQRFETENDDLSIFADHPIMDSDTRQVGVGGSSTLRTEESLLPHDLQRVTNEYRSMLETTSRKLDLVESEKSVLLQAIENRQIKLDHQPSIYPVVGRITDNYGYRIDPFTKSKRHHKGLDIAQRRGTPVKATAAGVVVLAKNHYKRNSGFGKVVKIDHGNGFTTIFGHLENINVKKGQKVKRHEIIGTVGSTGRSTGPHLHYEVLENGKNLNPKNFIIAE